MEDLLKNNLAPADNEITVRTYECTYYKAWLIGLEAKGYLGVTNKRVVFQAKGKSLSGNSIIQSEVPVSDVSGISSYKGFYFSLTHILLALIASAAISTVVVGLLTSWMVSNYYNNQSTTFVTVVMWVTAVAAFLLSISVKPAKVWKSVFAGLSAALFASLGGVDYLSNLAGSFFGGGMGGNGSSFPLVLAGLIGIYLLICLFLYSRRPTFSISIHSRGGSSTPISIASANGIAAVFMSAGRALNAQPAADAEKMLAEIGGMILDIQALGDTGVSRWKI